MFLTFFDVTGIFRYEFVPTGQTVDRVYYLEVLERLRGKVRWRRSELLADNPWILHHNNAPAHTALSVREFLATKRKCNIYNALIKSSLLYCDRWVRFNFLNVMLYFVFTVDL